MGDSENGKNGGKLSTKCENEYTQQSPVLPLEGSTGLYLWMIGRTCICKRKIYVRACDFLRVKGEHSVRSLVRKAPFLRGICCEGMVLCCLNMKSFADFFDEGFFDGGEGVGV